MKKGEYKYQRGSGAAVWAGVSGLAALGSGWTIQKDLVRVGIMILMNGH